MKYITMLFVAPSAGLDELHVLTDKAVALIISSCHNDWSNVWLWK